MPRLVVCLCERCGDWAELPSVIELGIGKQRRSWLLCLACMELYFFDLGKFCAGLPR